MASPRLLTESDRRALLEYISHEPEVNLFIRGDVEQFGMDEPVNVYAFENPDSTWDSILCRFYGNFVVYSPYTLYDARAVAKLIHAITGKHVHGTINGKLEVVGPLAGYFEELSLRSLNLARCTKVDHSAVADIPEEIEIRRLTPDDYDEMFALLSTMHVYRGLYDDPGTIAMAKQQRAANEAHGCVSYGAFLDGELVSTASTDAASSESAMLGGVGTRRDMRFEGIGTAVVAALVQECLDSGMKFVCAFSESPEDGALYERIGFRRIGSYSMLR